MSLASQRLHSRGAPFTPGTIIWGRVRKIGTGGAIYRKPLTMHPLCYA
jgi:hypothetical protein